MGDGTRVQIVLLGFFRLQLSTRIFLEFLAYIPSIRRNLISISILDKLGYNFLFGTGKVELHLDYLSIGNGIDERPKTLITYPGFGIF